LTEELAKLFQEAHLRIDRLEQAFNALLDDVARNPHTAVEMARSYLNQER